MYHGMDNHDPEHPAISKNVVLPSLRLLQTSGCDLQFEYGGVCSCEECIGYLSHQDKNHA